MRQLVQRLTERLAGGGVLLVVGASGAGKSSLLRAGLIPRLAAGALGPGSGRWPRRVIRPSGSPVRELALHLAEAAAVDPVSVYQSLLAAPREAPLLAKQVARAAAGQETVMPPRLILVIDQLEELFTAEDAADAERDAFVAALGALAAAPAGPLGVSAALVVAAVRADFLDQAIAYPPLAAAVGAGPFTVGPMSEAELRLAVAGPAAKAGLAVEADLVDAVIAELCGDQASASPGGGVLPLLSQAMAATWAQREGSTLSLRAYRRAGGVADAVNQGAESAYQTLTSAQQDRGPPDLHPG